MTSGQVQRYKLTSQDTIKVSQMGTTPVLEIGNYHFELPQGSDLQQFVNQWQQAGTQIQNLKGGSSGN